MKSTIVAALAAASISVLACEKAPTSPEVASGPSFITHGTVDGDAHPAVVLIIMDIDGTPAFRCRAPSSLRPSSYGWPLRGRARRLQRHPHLHRSPMLRERRQHVPFGGGPNSVEAVAWASHPEFTEAAFFLHDVGMIQLASPVVLPADEYGTLPTVDQLDALKPSSHTVFTVVGYGLQRFNPVQLDAELVREFAEPHLVQINKPRTFGGTALLLSTNASTGGQCFGDSGGPAYLGSTTWSPA